MYPASPVHVWTISNVRPVDLHFLVEPVVEHQRVGHRQSLGFHGVEGPVVEISDIRVVEVRHPGPGVAGGHCFYLKYQTINSYFTD